MSGYGPKCARKGCGSTVTDEGEALCRGCRKVRECSCGVTFESAVHSQCGRCRKVVCPVCSASKLPERRTCGEDDKAHRDFAHSYKYEEVSKKQRENQVLPYGGRGGSRR